MNRLKIIAVLLLAALLPTACGNLNDNKKISIAYAQSVEECSEMVSEPVDGCFYILSYVYHNSIAF